MQATLLTIDVDHSIFMSEEEEMEGKAWDQVFLAHAALGRDYRRAKRGRGSRKVQVDGGPRDHANITNIRGQEHVRRTRSRCTMELVHIVHEVDRIEPEECVEPERCVEPEDCAVPKDCVEPEECAVPEECAEAVTPLEWVNGILETPDETGTRTDVIDGDISTVVDGIKGDKDTFVIQEEEK